MQVIFRPKNNNMNIRLISGKFGGRKIVAPEGNKTHPMGERIRNALFNKIIDDVPGAHVLDAFAGTGALGLEAISRGAAHATFIEKDRLAQKALVTNIKMFQLEYNTTIVNAPLASWIDTYSGPKFDIIFADPPYDDVQFSTVSQLFGLLKPSALMVLSHPGRSESPTKPGVVVVDNRGYSGAVLTFYRREA